MPTSRAARFSSGLSIYDFLKRTSIIGCGPAAFQVLAGPTEALANAEGLPAHGEAVTGPAVIESGFTTIVLEPGSRARREPGQLVVEPRG